MVRIEPHRVRAPPQVVEKGWVEKLLKFKNKRGGCICAPSAIHGNAPKFTIQTLQDLNRLKNISGYLGSEIIVFDMADT